MSKFQRQFQLTVETKDGALEILGNPFTLHFNVVRHDLSSANTANFKILNLGLQDRERIFKNTFTDPEAYLRVQLRAGYEGMMPIIFRGNILDARSYRLPGSVDFITEIDAYDGGWDLAHGDSNFTMDPGTLRIDAIKWMAKDLKHCKLGAIGNFPGKYSRQRVFCGPTRQLIHDETGGNFYIDNEHIYCIKNDEAIEGDVLLISSETGLLGSPTRSELFVIADILFEPRIKVGQIVELASKDYPSLNQAYKVIGVQHSGTISDAVGGRCQTQIRMLYGQQSFKIVKGLQFV